MAPSRTTPSRFSFAQLLVAYDENPSDEPTEFVIPEDLAGLDDAALTELHGQAVSHFDEIYGDGTGLTEDDLATLATLTTGIEALAAEVTQRETAAAERATAAAELVARAHPDIEAVVQEAEAAAEGDDPNAPEQPETDVTTDPAAPPAEVTPLQPAAPAAPASIAASATERREIRVSLGANGSRRQRPAAPPAAPAGPAARMQDVVFANGEGTGFQPGEGLDWNGIGQVIDRRLGNFNLATYEAAARKGQHVRQQFSVATFNRQMPEELTIRSNDRMHIEEVMARAADESRLPGGSLVAAGGWCAPSEVMYDLVELESRDGIFSLPEVGISRGGISHTLGPDFAALYSAVGAEFNYTEQDDIDGDYDGAGGGSKPCYFVPCPDFTEDRLDTTGVCISAGLLQARGYPEVIARTTRGVLVAHDHKSAGRLLSGIVTGSTAVTMAAATPGVIAPLLYAIELQVEHYRYVTRISRAVSLEAVFPFWVRGAIRNDLARRNGVDMLDVTDAQIDAWFRLRGINPQFVYNWQDLTGGAAAALAYPTTVSFLLYAAGTWVKGTSDVITLDTIYDSVMLGENNYTALFTEEGWLLAKRAHDSRVVTVAIEGDGSTGYQVNFAANGTVTP